MVARFSFRTSDGSRLVGVVQGSGGFVEHASEMERGKRLASRGRRMHVPEPVPGCVIVYADFCNESNGPATMVPIAAYEGPVAS